MIICRCEWSQINHLGAKFYWQEVRQRNDHTAGNIHELHIIFTVVEQQDKVRKNNAAVRAPWRLCQNLRKVRAHKLRRDLLIVDTKLFHLIIVTSTDNLS